MVRIIEVRLKNYKNVSNGILKLSNGMELENEIGNVIGIYGQNGTGKTSIINAISIVRNLLIGRSLPEDIGEHITYGESETEISLGFYIILNKIRYKVVYNLILAKNEIATYIKEESIHYWYSEKGSSVWDRKTGLFINKYNKNNIEPNYRNKDLKKLYADENDLVVNKKIRFKNNESFIFSEDMRKQLLDNSQGLDDEYKIIGILYHFALSNMFIIGNKELALSNANIILPMSFKNYKNDNIYSMGVMPIGLEQATFLPRIAIEETLTALDASNKVISEIIPGLKIILKEIAVQTSKTGEEEVLVELFSSRKGIEIPIKYESDGIKKIIAVFHLLIAMFNYPSMTVLIDELDSGIFEYLLGEILEILEKKGKGQLIFTSHNLRPLEVLDKKNLVFTTTNIDNRYIRLKNIKPNNNLRDMYYRDIILGGQNEKIYEKTNSSKIARAFRKAGAYNG